MLIRKIISAFVLTLLAGVVAADAAYPAKTIVLVVPGPPGGITDTVGRVLATKLSDQLGKQVVVENRTGANGNVAGQYVARAPADGYTVMLGTQGTHATNQYLYKSLPFDAVKDFTPVHGLVLSPNILMVNSSSEFHSVKDLVEYARKNPGKLNVSSAGNGSGTHMAAALFQSETGVKFTHVPFSGSAVIVTSLIGGQVDLAFDYQVTTLAHIQSGKLRALAVTAKERLPALPQVPTIGEAGYPSALSAAWLGLFVPSKTPAAVVDKLQAEVSRAMQDPGVAESVQRLGGVPLKIGGEQFREFVQNERTRWKAVIEKSGATIG